MDPQADFSFVAPLLLFFDQVDFDIGRNGFEFRVGLQLHANDGLAWNCIRWDPHRAVIQHASTSFLQLRVDSVFLA